MPTTFGKRPPWLGRVLARGWPPVGWLLVVVALVLSAVVGLRVSLAPTLTVVAFGDSVPSGRGCGCRGFVETFAAMRATQVGADAATVNLAVDGDTSADVLSHVQGPAAQSAVEGADTVVLMIGANDFLDPLARDLEAQCSEMDCYTSVEQSVTANVTATIRSIRAIHRSPVAVLVVGYWNIAQDGSVGRAAYGVEGMAKADRATTHANNALLTAATAAGALYVPTFAAFRGSSGDQDATPLLAGDGDHPNAAGHARIAQALFTAATVPDPSSCCCTLPLAPRELGLTGLRGRLNGSPTE